MHDYYRWKAEWEELQRFGNPQGAECLRKFHLLTSLSEMVKKDLVLSSCGSADYVFRLLDNKYGKKAKIVLMISNEVLSLPPIKGNNPRKTIELIQGVERALGNRHNFRRRRRHKELCCHSFSGESAPQFTEKGMDYAQNLSC